MARLAPERRGSTYGLWPHEIGWPQDDGSRYFPLLTHDPLAIPPQQPDAPSLRRRLRQESRESHERLDARFDGMAEASRPDDYARFLRVNEACHRVIEPILATSPLPASVPEFAMRRRTPELAADLSSMGLSPIEAPAFPLPAPDVAEAIGIAYVIEGSRLGAGYILAKLRERPIEGDWKDAAFAYLESPDEPHALRRFLIGASAVLADEADVSRAVSAADATFAYFLDVEGLSRAEAVR